MVYSQHKQPEHGAYSGRLTPQILAEALGWIDWKRTVAFACGPEGFLQAVEPALSHFGTAVLTERFNF